MKKKYWIICILIFVSYLCLWILTSFVGTKAINNFNKNINSSEELFRTNRKKLFAIPNPSKKTHTPFVIFLDEFSPLPFIVISEVEDKYGSNSFCVNTIWFWFFGFKHELKSSTIWKNDKQK